MMVVARAYRYLPEHIKRQANLDAKLILNDVFKSAQPDWATPTYIAPVNTQAASIDINREKDIKRDAAIKKKKLAAKNLDISLLDDFEYKIDLKHELDNEPKLER